MPRGEQTIKPSRAATAATGTEGEEQDGDDRLGTKAPAVGPWLGGGLSPTKTVSSARRGRWTRWTSGSLLEVSPSLLSCVPTCSNTPREIGLCGRFKSITLGGEDYLRLHGFMLRSI